MDQLLNVTIIDVAKQASEVVKDCQESWYQTSIEMEEFKVLQTRLEQKKLAYIEALRTTGLSNEKSVTEPLKEAVTCLMEESKKIDAVQNNCCMSYLFKTRLVFPVHLKDSMQKVVEAFEDIPKLVLERRESNQWLEDVADTIPIPEEFSIDRRIVTFEKIEGRVKSRLEDADGNQVITIFGGFGSGKTCLAKSLAQHYHKLKESNESQDTTIVFKDGVQLLSCGREANSAFLIAQLLQRLGHDNRLLSNQENMIKKQTSSNPGGQSDSELQSNIRRLTRRLMERNLLIILDDVYDPKLLKDLIVPHAKSVKYLITSQRKNVWDGATEIRMGPPTVEEALNILGNYIPNLPNGEIPAGFQDIAYNLISKANRLPKTLATIGKNIDNPYDKTSWDEAYTNFYQLLARKPESVDENFVDHRQYEYDVVASMRMAVKAIASSNCKDLANLIALCEPSQFIPERLFELFLKRIDPSGHNGSFRQQRKQLEDQDVLKIQNYEWVLSGPHQHFMRSENKQEISKVLCTLLRPSDNTEEDDLLRALCLLFVTFDNTVFTDDAFTMLNHAGEQLDGSLINQHVKIEKVRVAVKPFIHMLLPSKVKKTKQWELRRHQLVSKVIMRFIFYHDLDDESCAQLLDGKETFHDCCIALLAMYKEWGKQLLSIHTKQTLGRLLDVFELGLEDEIKSIALEVLSSLPSGQICSDILENECLQDAILTPLLQGGDLQSAALLGLHGLANSPSARSKICEFKGLIEVFVNMLNRPQDEVDSSIKQQVVLVLSNLGWDKLTSIKLIETPGLLLGLLQLLDMQSVDQDSTIEIQWMVLNCIERFLQANPSNRAALIASHSNLENVIARFLDSNVEVVVQAEAVHVLTLLDDNKYNNIKNLSSSHIVEQARGLANLELGLYKEALKHFKIADFYDDEDDEFYKVHISIIKAMMKDYEAALIYANQAVEAAEATTDDISYVLQERGVLKELMENYEGALEDLTRAIQLDSDDYEQLKHRAYVNFKLGREKEAREDAEKALQSPTRFQADLPGYGTYLAKLAVPEFLGYNFR